MHSTNEVMNTHMSSTKNLRKNIMSISNEAAAACEGLNFYNLSDDSDEDMPKPKKLKTAKPLKNSLGLINEEDESDEEKKEPVIEIEAGDLGMSHEACKVNIYKQLDSMASTMKNFTIDIEQRLEKAYKQGPQKKFGYERNSENGSQMSDRSDKSIKKALGSK